MGEEVMFTPVIVYGFFCLFWAYANTKGIQANAYIVHWANMIVHTTFCLYFGWQKGYLCGLALFFEARPFFDTALNIFRFGVKRIGYVPPNPASTIDRLEITLFEKLFYFARNRFKFGSYSFLVGILPKLIYTALFALFLILYAMR